MSGTSVLKVSTQDTTSGMRESHPVKTWVVAGLFLAMVETYTSRNAIATDGIGYLESACAYARGDWKWAINTYWSPLYSWILALFLKLVPHTAKMEFPLVHCVNFICFAFTLWCFERFWKELTISAEDLGEQSLFSSVDSRIVDAFRYSLFLFFFVPLMGVVIADVLASGFVFLISEQMLRWRRTQNYTLTYGLFLGVLIAFAFFAKAILLYFGIFSVICAVITQDFRHKIRTAVMAALTVVILIAPWAFAQKRVSGRWALGSSARLAYVWLVDGTSAGDYLQPGGPPIGFVPSERLMPGLDAFTLRTSDHITYMPWYDPGRMDQTPARFSLTGEIRAIHRNVLWLRIWLLDTLGALVVALLALALFHPRIWWKRAYHRYAVLFVPCLAVFGMYSLIFIRSPRYLVAMTIVMFGAGMAAVRVQRDARRYVCQLLIAALTVFWMLTVPDNLRGIFTTPSENIESTRIAQGLEIKLPPKTRIAVIGLGGGGGAGWAHLAQTPIAGEVWDTSLAQFWNLQCSERQEVLSKMRDAGANFAVAVPPPRLLLEGWQRLYPSQRTYILPLEASPVLRCNQ